MSNTLEITHAQTGDSNKESTIATAIDKLANAITATASVVFGSDANKTVTLDDIVGGFLLIVTSSGSLTATRELVVPTNKRPFVVRNSTTGSQSITVKTASGTGITVANGADKLLFCDGTNIVELGGASYTAGNGLTLTGNDFAVGAGTGITVNANDVAVDTSVIGKKLDLQVFSASGSHTWTKPSGAQFVEAIVIGAGGGAGSGRRGAASSERYGGGGGGGGGYSQHRWRASALGATETVTVGAKGTGGAAQTADSTNGNAGTDGGVSSFGSWCKATGGKGGSGGGTTSTAGGQGGYGTRWMGYNGSPTACQSYDGGTGNGSGAGASVNGGYWAPFGGGGGGRINASNTYLPGGTGGQINNTGYTGMLTFAGGTGGTSADTPTAGGAGNSIDGDIYTGPGGGGASKTQAGANGANGTQGSGGGGGGASTNGFNSGAGGDGGDGLVIVLSWY